MQASLPPDALAVFVNVLTGDELAAGHYFREADKFQFKENAEVTQAVKRLADSFFSAPTCLLDLEPRADSFTRGSRLEIPESLDDLIQLAGSPDTLRQGMIDYDESNVEMNVYYNEDALEELSSVAPGRTDRNGFLERAGL